MGIGARRGKRSRCFSSQKPPATEDDRTKQREENEEDQGDNEGDVKGGEQFFPLCFEPDDCPGIEAQGGEYATGEDQQFASDLAT
jgi:hypothetical protein